MVESLLTVLLRKIVKVLLELCRMVLYMGLFSSMRSSVRQSITLTLITAFALSTAALTGCRFASLPKNIPFLNRTAASDTTEKAPESQVPEPHAAPAQGHVAGLFQNLNLRRTVEADPNKEYRLTETDGPFIIFAAGFSGPNARQDAHSVVLDLRRTNNWHAYVYEMKPDFDVQTDFRQARHNVHPGRAAQYRNRGGEPEFAVVIGNFASMEDRQLIRTLEEVRKTLPESLKGRGSPTPFSMAFPVANPMLPPKHQQGVVDAFVESLNRGPYSLLRNPHPYTVQVATFVTGITVMERTSNISSLLNRHTDNDSDLAAELERGEQKAMTLVSALRERGHEAYVFHDRQRSIVTVGGFEQNQQMAIEQTMRQFRGQPLGNGAFRPVVINGIVCDPQPRLIAVPRARR